MIHSFNANYLSIPEGTGRSGHLFHEIPGMTLFCGTPCICMTIRYTLNTSKDD